MYSTISQVLYSLILFIAIYSNLLITFVVYVSSIPLEHSASSTNHETPHYQIFSASSLTYSITFTNITVLSYIVNFIILQVSTTLYIFSSFFVDEAFKLL